MREAHRMTSRYATVWSPWKPIAEPARGDEAAAYRVRLICASVPALIPRFLGVDHSGILALGESHHFDRRRRQFCRALRCGQGHSEGNLLWWLSLHSALLRQFPGASYEYSVCALRSKAEAKAMEAELIKEYVVEFGEVPPLNSAMPGRIQWIADVRATIRQPV